MIGNPINMTNFWTGFPLHRPSILNYGFSQISTEAKMGTTSGSMKNV